MADTTLEKRSKGPARQFSIRAVLLATLAVAGLLAVWKGGLPPSLAGALWLAAGGLIGALDYSRRRGIGSVRGPLFSGALAGFLAGLAWTAIGLMTLLPAHGPWQSFVWPGPSLAFFGYWWCATGTLMGGAIGYAVACRRELSSRWQPSETADPLAEVDLGPLRVSTTVSRRDGLRSAWRAARRVTPSWFVSAHVHVMVWIALSVTALGLGGRTARPQSRPLDPILAVWSEPPSAAAHVTDGARIVPSDNPSPRPAVVEISNLPAPRVEPVQETPRQAPNPDRMPRAETVPTRQPSVESDTPGGSRVHVVGLSGGMTPIGTPRGQTVMGRAEVQVTYTGAPVVLVLCAYNPVKWSVTVGPGAKIERVIVSGYHHQEIEGVPAGVPLLSQSYDDGTGYFGTYKRDLNRYPRVVRRIQKATGMDVATFQGACDYKGQPFVVGPQSKEWTESYDRYLRMDELRAKELETQRTTRPSVGDLSFSGMWRVRKGPFTQAYYGSLTLDGPVKDSLASMPHNFNAVAVDPKGESYGIYQHEAYQLDRQMRAKKLPIPSSLPPLSWPCGATFDTKRGRFLVSTIGGEGHLYAYDTATSQWSLLTNLNNVEWYSMVYSPEDDAIYAINDGYEGKWELYKRSPHGKLLSRTPLGNVIPARNHGGQVDLFLADGRLVLVGPAFHHIDARGMPAIYPIVVLDRATGNVLWKGEIPAESVGDVSD